MKICFPLGPYGPEKVPEIFIHAIQQSKNKPFDRLLFGLGIRFVGSTVARDLADAYSTIDALMQASEDQIADVHGIGVKIAASVRDFMDRPEKPTNNRTTPGLWLEIAS